MINRLFLFLKLVWVISFLCINMPGEHEIPLFFGVILFSYEFIYDIITLPEPHVFMWEGLLSVFVIGTLIAGFKVKLYKDRYSFVLCHKSLLCTLGFFLGFSNSSMTSGIFHLYSIFVF